MRGLSAERLFYSRLGCKGWCCERMSHGVSCRIYSIHGFVVKVSF
ncbi:hypothetical protein MIZ03_3272 [Rhodoferax lithotrophicus]|uniref:Uncharacterized protein n=1 Tax=Rhodoferax lithotrophicus TaxID=2798804 RepID=A0ABM7MPY0_9BURK|nr:hypothetical protein MIZ03_3272 [Rhodoferax sp. MIZ03]